MSRISIWMLALVASLSQPAVAADGVMYTCVDAKGARTYQNAPCPKSSATHGARSYVDPGWNTQAAAKVESDRQAVEARRNGSSGGYSFGRPASRDADPKVMRCRNARAHREAVLQAVGLKRTYDLLSELDREVWEACKDVPGAVCRGEGCKS